MTDKQIGQTASDLERDPRVAGKIRRLLSESGQQSSLVPRVERIEITRDWVGQGIARIAADETIKPNVRLSAYVHAGKLTGVDAFREIVVHEKHVRTLEEIDREIARHLASMIDVTPNAPGSSLPVIDQAPAVPAARDRRRKPTPG